MQIPHLLISASILFAIKEKAVPVLCNDERLLPDLGVLRSYPKKGNKNCHNFKELKPP